jgi:predicted RNase H-like nuclease (RuvC/YqgF family)
LETPATVVAPDPVPPAADARIRSILENKTRIEEFFTFALESSTEATNLGAANEKLQAENAKMQAENAKLQAANEKLQAANEKLVEEESKRQDEFDKKREYLKKALCEIIGG